MATPPSHLSAYFLIRSLRLVTLTACLPLLSAAQTQLQVYKLASDSPLTTDGRLIYALADDARTILVGQGTSWSKIWESPSPVAGLTFGQGTLYFSVPSEATIYALDGSVAKPLEIGTRLRTPSALAFADSLVVADPALHTVFQMAVSNTRGLAQLNTPEGPIALAADATRIVATSPDAGEVRMWRPYERARLWTTNCKDQCSPPPSDSTPRVFIVPPPLIVRPANPALARGNTYLVDALSGRLYVARDLSRPAAINLPESVLSVSSVVAVGDSLYVLESNRGVLERLALPLPLDVTLGERSGDALFALLTYVAPRQVIPVRRVNWRGSLDRTLSGERLLAMLTPEQRHQIVCLLNKNLCTGASFTPKQVNVPDLEVDGEVEFETIAATELGDHTLGDELERRVVTSELRAYASEDALWEANGDSLTIVNQQAGQSHPGKPLSQRAAYGPYTKGHLGGLYASDFPPEWKLTVPSETRHCLIAVPADLAYDEKAQSLIRLISRGFSWSVLEDRVPSPSQLSAPAQTPSPTFTAPASCAWETLRAAQAELLRAINYELPPLFHATPLLIGIAQNDIDFLHPDFATVNGNPLEAFSLLPSQVSPAPPATPTPSAQLAQAALPVSPATGSPASPETLSSAAACQVKAVLEKQDHATAVAGLIAARGGQSGLRGLAPTVRLVPLRSDDDGLAKDIAGAIGRNVHIFNLSIHYGSGPAPEVRRTINAFPNALFVVAAGNDSPQDGKAVCDAPLPYPAYPVCEGYRKNVLVVTATGMAGDSLIDPNGGRPGANWNPRFVHIAAPGTGFFALARGGVYAPVDGTSFAAPLVTATAALLYQEGVMDPWLIKQRIIATADPKNGLHDRLVGAGLLNVRRALAWPRNAVIVPNSGPERVVDIEDGEIQLRWFQGAYARVLPLRSIRRLTRSGTGFWRVVFFDDLTDELVVKDEVDPGPWPIRYKTTDVASPPINDNIENFADYVGPIIF